MTQTDLLEKQLEMLFSDVAAPDLTGARERRSRRGAAPTSQSPLLPRFDVPHPIPAAPDQVLRQPHQSRLVKQSLVVLAFFSVLIVLLIGRENIAWLTTRTYSLASNVHDVHPAAAHPASQALPTARLTPAVMPFAPPSSPVPTATGTSDLQPTIEPVAVLMDGEKREPTQSVAPSPFPATPDRAEPTATQQIRPASTDSRPTRQTATLEPTEPSTFAGEVGPVFTLAPTASAAVPKPTLSLSNTLVIPAINLEAPIVEVGYESQVIDGTSAITWAVPEFFAVGWHQSSAPPGQHGNTVLNGHEYIHGGVFQELVKLQEDDEIIVHSEGTAHHYRVSEQHIFKEEGQSLAVRVENAQWILPTEDERLTIVTCAPHKKSTHRLIVVAFPVDDEILSTP